MLDGRKTVVQYHVLHMKLTVFVGSPPRFVFRQFDVAIFGSQLHHRIEQYNGQVACHQLQQQQVAFLLRTQPAFQMQHADASFRAACFHHQRQHLCARGKQCFLLLHTLFYQFHPYAFIIPRLPRATCIIQPMSIFIVYCNAQPVDADKLVHGMECLVRYPLGN